MKILRVLLKGEWMAAEFENGCFVNALDDRLNWMAGMSAREVGQILRARGAAWRWVDLDAEVKGSRC